MKKVLSFLFVGLLVFATPFLMLGCSKNNDNENNLPWDTPQFRNTNQVENATTNFALIASLNEFYINHAKNTPSTAIQGYARDIPYQPTQAEIELSEKAKIAFVNGFRNDTYSKTLPFNADFLIYWFENTYFHFAPKTDNELSMRGTWRNGSANNNRAVFVATHFENGTETLDYPYSPFAWIFIHETGHDLGLVDYYPIINGLWADSFMYENKSLTPQTEPSHALYENIGASTFWGTVFHSQNEYKKLMRENDFEPTTTYYVEWSARQVKPIKTEKDLPIEWIAVAATFGVLILSVLAIVIRKKIRQKK